jgi:hypothetical protein
MADMELTQELADKFCSSLKSFHESLPDEEKQVLDQVLEQASQAEESPAEGRAKSGRPFFDKFLTLNPQGDRFQKPGDFVTLKFPSDSDESDTQAY